MNDDLDRVGAPMGEIERLDQAYCALIDRAEAEPELWLDPDVVDAEQNLIDSMIRTAWTAHAACWSAMQATSDMAARRRYRRLADEYLAVVSNLTETATDEEAEPIKGLREGLATARARNDGSRARRHEHFRAAWTLRSVLDRRSLTGDLDAELAAVESSLTS